MSGIFLLLLFSFFVGIAHPNIKFSKGVYNFVFTLLLITLFIISGFRQNLGWDTQQYLDIISGQASSDGIELFHVELMRLSREIGYPQIYFVVTSFITYFFFFCAICNTVPVERRIISVFCFLCFPIGFFDSVSIVRQYVSISCFMFIFSQRRINFNSVVAILIGGASHVSFWIALPFIFIFRIKKTVIRPTMVLAIILSGLLLIHSYLLSVILSRLDYVHAYASMNNSGSLMAISIVVLPMLLYLDYIILGDSAFKYYDVKSVNVILFGVMFFVLMFSISIHAARIAYYPLMILPLVIVKSITSNSRYIFFISYMIFCYLARLYIASVSGFDYINNFYLNL